MRLCDFSFCSYKVRKISLSSQGSCESMEMREGSSQWAGKHSSPQGGCMHGGRLTGRAALYQGSLCGSGPADDISRVALVRGAHRAGGCDGRPGLQAQPPQCCDVHFGAATGMGRLALIWRPPGRPCTMLYPPPHSIIMGLIFIEMCNLYTIKFTPLEDTILCL